MNYIEIKAPAKINIGLDILSKRTDGYHNLNTLFYPIHDLFDILKFRKSSQFSFDCNESTIPHDEKNIVVKAQLLLKKVTGRVLNVEISLEKRIPSQAGLGGGSSDAAATLISLNEMFQLGLKYEQLLDLSLELGSDVPFFIKAKPSIASLRGEILYPVELEINDPILIINPRIDISTKAAFSKITPKELQIDYKKIINYENLDYNRARQLLKNDFEESVFSEYPEIGNIKKLLYDSGAKLALMSGSGSTVFGIFDSMEEIDKIISSLPNHYFHFRSIPLE